MYRRLILSQLLSASNRRVTLGRKIFLNNQINQYHLSVRKLPSITEQKFSITGGITTVRCKYVKGKHSSKKNDQDSDDEEEVKYEEDDEESKLLDKASKTIKVGVKSLRTDLIIKSGLGIARK